MTPASARIGVAPLDEKVVERQVQNTQYALKFVGAAFSSALHWLLLTEIGPLTNHIRSTDMASSATVNPTDMWVETRRHEGYLHR